MVKVLEDKSIEKYKTYLLVKGLLEIFEIDFSNSLKLVTQYNSLYLLIAIIVIHNLDTA